MSSLAKELQKKAKDKAGKVVSRAAKDGVLSGKEFKDLQREGFWHGAVSGPSSSYVANEIARQLRQNPDLKIDKDASKLTGIKQTKSGTLVHDPRGRTRGFNLFGSGDDPGSAKWVQNSKGSYTYIGDLTPRSQQAPSNEAAPVGPTVDPNPTQGLIDAANNVNNGGSSSSGGTNAAGDNNGSIHFNPGADMIAAVSDYGNRATDDYVNRFLPDLKNQAILQAQEIGNSMNFHIGRFQGKAPELGDAKDLYKYYSSRLG